MACHGHGANAAMEFQGGPTSSSPVVPYGYEGVMGPGFGA